MYWGAGTLAYNDTCRTLPHCGRAPQALPAGNATGSMRQEVSVLYLRNPLCSRASKTHTSSTQRYSSVYNARLMSALLPTVDNSSM